MIRSRFAPVPTRSPRPSTRHARSRTASALPLSLLAVAIALPAGAELTIDWPHCSPSNDLDLNPGGTLVCGSGPGVDLPSTDVIVEFVGPEPFERLTSTPLTGVTASVAAGATITEPDTSGLFGPRGSTTLINNGSILAFVSGMTVLGSGSTLTNKGDITVAGDPDGSEGLGAEGAGVVLTNAATGTITANGTFAEAIGLEGDGGRITNAGDIVVGGFEASGLGIEGDDGVIENLATGTVTIAGDQLSGALGIDGDDGEITNAGNLLLNGFAHFGIATFGARNRITHTGNLFADGAPGSAGISVIGPAGSLTLGSGSRVDTAAFSANVVLAGGGSEGSGTLVELAVGSGVTFSAAPSATLNVGAGSVGVLLAHDGADIDALPVIQSSATGAVGAALFGSGIDVEVTNFASLTGDDSTLLAIGTQAGGAPGFAVVGTATDDAIVTLAESVSLPGTGSTIVRTAGNGHAVTVTATGNLVTGDGGTTIRVDGDDATITTEADALLTNGDVVVNGATPTVTHRGRLERAGIAVDGSAGSGTTTVRHFGTIDTATATDATALAVTGGTGPIVVAIGAPAETGVVEGSTTAYGVDVASVAGPVEVSVSPSSRIDVPDAAALRIVASNLVPAATVTAEGAISGNSGVSVRSGDLATITTNGVAVTENVAWLEGTTDTGLAIEAEADRLSWTADGSTTVASAASPGFSRAAVSLTGLSGERADRIDLDYQDTMPGTAFTASGPLLSGLHLEADVIQGDLLVPSFTVAGTGPNPVHGIDAAIGTEHALRVGSLAVPMVWTVDAEAEATGYLVTAQGGDPQVTATNAATLEVSSPVRPVGMAIRTSAGLAAPAPGTAFAFLPTRRALANDTGRIELSGGSGAIGMHVGPDANAVRVTNGGEIVAGGPAPGARGIAVKNATRAFVVNGGAILLGEGDAVRGIQVHGSENVVINGANDAAIIPTRGRFVTAEGTFPTASAFTAVSVGLDFLTQDQDGFPLLGEIVVSGTDAVGIDVNGNDNVIATVLGAGVIPLEVPLTDVVATGTNAIGVRLAGDGNVFANYGNVQATTYSVRGDAGDQVVYNGGFLQGPVDLGAGDDAYGFLAGIDQPPVDGGAQTVEDVLYTTAPSDAGYVANFDVFSGFERFQKGGPGVVAVEGVVQVPVGEVFEGALVLLAGSAVAGDLFCLSGAAVLGEGLVVGDLDGDGCLISPSIGQLGLPPLSLGPAAARAPSMTGPSTMDAETTARLQIGGDLRLTGGSLEFVVAGPGDFDSLAVGGNLDLAGTTLRVRFVDGYVPGAEDRFGLFAAGGSVTGLETTTFVLDGAEGTATFVPDGAGGFDAVFDVTATAPVVVPALGRGLALIGFLVLVALGLRLRRAGPARV
jgi:hypothetical protein